MACETERWFYSCLLYTSWPKLAVNFTAKTQFVYRINKGVLDVSDDQTLNASMPDDSKRVPFTNMIYIGDGLSDCLLYTSALQIATEILAALGLQ